MIIYWYSHYIILYAIKLYIYIYIHTYSSTVHLGYSFYSFTPFWRLLFIVLYTRPRVQFIIVLYSEPSARISFELLALNHLYIIVSSTFFDRIRMANLLNEIRKPLDFPCALCWYFFFFFFQNYIIVTRFNVTTVYFQ